MNWTMRQWQVKVDQAGNMMSTWQRRDPDRGSERSAQGGGRSERTTEQETQDPVRHMRSEPMSRRHARRHRWGVNAACGGRRRRVNPGIVVWAGAGENVNARGMDEVQRLLGGIQSPRGIIPGGMQTPSMVC